jgi:hypothetical protein
LERDVYDKRKLAELALSCFVRPVYKPISDAKKIGYEYPDSIGHLGQHKNDEVTYDGRSFFRGEIYPFAVVFVINGRETEAFPILGHDYTVGLLRTQMRRALLRCQILTWCSWCKSKVQ